MSYDVSALFTSIPIEPAINIIKKHLEEDKELHLRTSMMVKHISCLLEFCLKNTYFSFQGRFYEQTEGAAMGSPIRPIVANLFMEDLEVQAIRTSTTPPALWKRFVDDTFTIVKKDNRNSFLVTQFIPTSSSPFTSIPIEPAINIIKKHLEEDRELHHRTSMTVKHISCLLEFCLKNTYFSFQGRFYEQTEGAAMGSPIRPIVANLFMEDLEVQAIRTSTTPPALWKRFVDDTFTIVKKDNRNSFLETQFITTSSSPVKKQEEMDPCLSLTSLLQLKKMAASEHQCIENLHVTRLMCSPLAGNF